MSPKKKRATATLDTSQLRKGAVARAGVRALAKMASEKPKSATKQRRVQQPLSLLTPAEREQLGAWTAYAAAHKRLLKATGAASLEVAEARVRTTQAHFDELRRQHNRTRVAKSKRPSGDGKRTSIRTVSGGLPGGGKRR